MQRFVPLLSFLLLYGCVVVDGPVPGSPCEVYLQPVNPMLMKASTQMATPFQFDGDRPTVTGTLVSTDIHWIIVDTAGATDGVQRIYIPRENVFAITRK